jgi:hypothetical protein
VTTRDDDPTFDRTISARTTLDPAQKIMAKPNIVAAIAKLMFLRMRASDFLRAARYGERRLSWNGVYLGLQTSVVI